MQHNAIVTDENYKGFNPVQFGYEDCQKGHCYGPAIRPFWLIHFVVSGFGYYKIGNKEYDIGPGEMFVIPPFEETFYEAHKDNPWSYIWIGFTACNGLPVKLDHVIHCPEAINVFNSMKNCESFNLGKSAYLSAKIWELFATILCNKKTQTDYVQIALDCIHSGYMNDITVEQLAHNLNLDRCYFSTLFKKKTGMSPKQYITNYRMSIASSLMLDTKATVTVAANSVGYTDIFNFSKAFKKYYDMSPSEYIRKKLCN